MQPSTTTTEIPHDKWHSFLDGLTLQRLGWPVTVEVISSEYGAQVEARTLPFRGIVVDKAPHERISIMLGDAADRHVTHSIDTPSDLIVEQTETDRGTVETVMIRSATGTTTLLHIDTGAAPERFDEIL